MNDEKRSNLIRQSLQVVCHIVEIEHSNQWLETWRLRRRKGFTLVVWRFGLKDGSSDTLIDKADGKLSTKVLTYLIEVGTKLTRSFPQAYTEIEVGLPTS
jgi:hypothetical protein